jgi:hypothetical protein
MIIWLGELLIEKLKNGAAAAGEVAVVLELTELDVLEEVAAELEDVVVLEDGVVLEDVIVLEGVVMVLDVDVVLVEETFCADFG